MSASTDWLSDPEVSRKIAVMAAESAAEAAYVAKRSPELLVEYRRNVGKVREALSDALLMSRNGDAIARAYIAGDAIEFNRLLSVAVYARLKEQAEWDAGEAFWATQK